MLADPLKATYDDLLRQLNRGIIPDGFQAKARCPLCHGSNTIRKQIGYDDEKKKPVTARVGCPCIERQIIAEYHREQRKLAKAVSSPATPEKKGPRQPTRKVLERRARLQNTVDSRKKKLEGAEQLVADLEEQVELGTVEMREEMNELQEELGRLNDATGHAYKVHDELEETAKAIQEQLARVHEALRGLASDREEVNGKVEAVVAQIDGVKERRAVDLGRARARMENARRNYDTSFGKLQSLDRMIDAGNA